MRPSIVYVSLDTTRADRLGLYGAERPTSPQLDALAEHALVFDAMRAPSGNTLLSHASLFTGLFPRAHGARPAGKVAALPDAARTLAEDFAEAGYDCAAFTTHAEWLSPAFGMHQGFDHFDASRDAAPQVLQRVRAWLDARESERPFFLFVHLFDVHSDQHGRPYAAPESTAGRFTQPPGEVARDWEVEPVGGSLFLRGVHRGYLELRPGEVDELLAQYDEGLLALDAEIGAFLTEVRNERAPRAWISVSADHGEEFFEHGSPLHYSLYEEILRIPWLLVPPARAAPAWATPRRLAAPVSLLDVRRTLVALAGLPRASADHGRDLLPWLRGERGPPKPTPFPLLTAGLIMENWKLVRPPGGAWELYDLAHDPHELNDLAATERGREPLANLLAELQRLDEEHVVIANALHSQEVRASPELDAEAQQHLEALGYTR
ncbi:MAG: hypothetical protein DHS20C15_05180 [Planctomycetota bacterium]|nr:MAG: hypothetical protein DHS20C15_05180 [Planctomycetota bacterium]